MNEALHQKLREKYGTEQVYVIPFNKASMVPDSFSAPCCLPSVKKLDGEFILRSDAEYNMVFIQIIPYILVLNQTYDKIYVMRRIAGEERLKDSLSLGCGGHINPVDIGTGNLIYNAAIREMNEELNIVSPSKLKIVGTVRDMKSQTADHLGIVMITAAKRVTVKEKESLKGKWMTFDDLFHNYDKFESWARIIIDAMYLNGKSIKSLLSR